MIDELYGDLFEKRHPMVAHGVNCRGVMGAGVAARFAKEYPKSYKAYVKACDRFPPELLLGKVQCIEEEDGTYGVNLFTQRDYGRKQIRYVSYDAIDDCFVELDRKVRRLHPEYIAMPAIGSGLGGGSWLVIKQIIESVMDPLTEIRVYSLMQLTEKGFQMI